MTGSENIKAAVDNLVNNVFPALAARVQVLIDAVNNTADAGMTGPQVEAHLVELEALATALSTVGENPGGPISLPAVAAMPGPLRKG